MPRQGARVLERQSSQQIVSVRMQERQARAAWWRLYVPSTFVALVMVWFAMGSAPHPFSLSLLLFLAGIVWILARPTMGIYLIVFLAMAGDGRVASWYPFMKNLSSRESILFVADALTFSPLEFYIGVTAVAWALHALHHRGTRFHLGRLFVPAAIFTFFVVYGYAWGRYTGGDLRIAIFEGRALFLVLAFYALITNLFTERRQYRRVMVVAMVGVLIQSLFALWYYQGLESSVRSQLESLTEHGAAVHLGALFILTASLCLFPGCSKWLKWTMIAFTAVGLISFALAQRRSGFNALALGSIMLLVVLYHVRRPTFKWFAPTVVILGVGYILAFWSVSGPLGFGAQAVKSVIAPEQLDGVDRNSNLYRQIENTNLWFTIRTDPLRGIGFGRRFYQPWPLPSLGPNFEFRDYFPHNSMLWIWLKMGYFGFVATIFLFARTIWFGARNIFRVQGDELAFMMTATAYVLMYAVFAYVDIGWDDRSMIFLALCMAWCADAIHTPTDQVPDDAAAQTSNGRPRPRRAAQQLVTA